MHRWIFRGLLGLAFAVGQPASAEFVIADYLQFAPGNQWTYLENGVDLSTISVLTDTEDVGGVPTLVLETLGGDLPGRENFTVDVDGVQLHKLFLAASGGDPEGTANFDAPIKIFDAMIDMGQVIRSQVEGDLLIQGLGFPVDFSIDYQATVVGLQQVSVPFGDFEALVIDSTLTGVGMALGQTIEVTTGGMEFYVNGIGLVRSVSTDGDVRELTGTNVPEPGTAVLVGAGLLGLAARRRLALV